jgi:2-dehydropantoate 2-reductase
VRYVVVGAGAIGGSVGVRLHESGRSIVLVARGGHLAAIRENGLRLDEPHRSVVAHLPVVGAVSAVDWGPGDVVLLCTKTQDSRGVLDQLPADVPVVCVQNGVANERWAAERLTHVMGICVQMPAEHLEPGRVAAYAAPVPGLLDIGRYPHGTDHLTEQIAADLTAAGFSSQPDPAIMRAKYWKLLGNLGNAAETICGPDDPDLPALYAAARAEGERCLTASGIEFASETERQQRRADVMALPLVDGRVRSGGSTWQSLRRGAGSVESAFINGEIVALGARHGVPTPVNAVLARIADAMALAGDQPGAKKAADILAERPAADRRPVHSSLSGTSQMPSSD